MTKYSEIDSVQNNFMYICSLCGKKFKWESEKKRHELSHNPQYSCQICNKKFSFLSALRRHEKNHERTEPVHCKECGGTFRDETLLKRHLKYAHNGETYNCTSCPASFSSEVALRTHSKIHRGKSERRYKCSFLDCDKSFNFPHHLKHHELAHTGSKQHYCAICGKGFIQAHHLKTHMKGHSPDSWMSCTAPDCHKRFSNKYALKRHLLTHRKVLGSALDGKALSLKPLTLCDICGQLYPKTRIAKHSATCRRKNNLIKEEVEENSLSVIEEEYSNTSLDDISEIMDKRTLDVIVDEMSMMDLRTACNSLNLGLDDSFAEETNDLCINTTSTCIYNIPIEEITQQDLNINQNDSSLYNNEIQYSKEDTFDVVNDDLKNHINSLDDNVDENTNVEFSNDCKNVLGVCLVETDDKCICAKMSNNTKNITKEATNSQNDTSSTKCISTDKCNKCDKFTDFCNGRNKETEILNNNNQIDLIVNNNSVLNDDYKTEDDKKLHGFEQGGVPFNSCKAIFGNCIVSGDDTIGEGCLCAKMYNNGANSPQEIEDITPFVQMSWAD